MSVPLTVTAQVQTLAIGVVTSGPTTSVARISLTPAAVPATRTNHSLHIRARVRSSAQTTVWMALYEGPLNRSGDLQSAQLTTSLAEYVLPIPDANAATIVDYTNLEVRIWGTDAASNTPVLEVADVWFSAPATAIAFLTPSAQVQAEVSPVFVLVGSVGALSGFAGINTALTPAWGAGESRTAGNLLLCWVYGAPLLTPPTAPAGWSIAMQQAGGLCSVSLFYRVATGGDAAPTVPAVSGVTMQGQLAEFSGSTAMAAIDQSAGNSDIVSPLVVTTAGVDDSFGELVVFCAGAHYATSAPATLAVTLNNGAIVSETTNNALTVGNHIDFGWGITIGNASADSASFAFSGTPSGNAPILVVSFGLNSPLLTAPALMSPVAVAVALVQATTVATTSFVATTGAVAQAQAVVVTPAGLSRTTADISLTTDAVIGISAKGRLASDTSLTSDATSRLLRRFRVLSDVSLTSDAESALRRLSRALSDISLTSDAVVRFLPTPRIKLPTMATLRVYSSYVAVSAHSTTAGLTIRTYRATISFYQSSSTVKSYSSTSTIKVNGFVSTPRGGYSSAGFVTPYSSKVSAIGGNG